MRTLEEITANLICVVDEYDNLPLDDVKQLSELLRVLGVNISYLVHVRDVYNKEYNRVYYSSQERTEAGKGREADRKVPELDLVRKILRHYTNLQQDIRSQISLRKTID